MIVTVFLILGAIATLATLGWLAWIIVGVRLTKPTVRLEFEKTIGRENRPLLQVSFFNDPLSGWLAELLGVRRRNIEEFTMFAAIASADGAFACEIEPALHDRQSSHDIAHPLPASPFGLYAPIATYTDQGAIVIDSNTQTVTVLPPDTYECRILIHADEVDVRVMAHRFIVGAESTLFEWIGDAYNVGRRKALR